MIFEAGRDLDMGDRPLRRKRDLFGDFCGALVIIMLALIAYGVLGE